MAAEIKRLAATPALTPASTGRINGEDTTQPDLYATAFVQRLLTQDYATPRGDLLAWVQAESAQTTEPLVVGLVPANLRNRLAVYSVTDDTDSSALVPTAVRWTSLGRQHAHSTVTIENVNEPLAWSNAVAGGRITDAGVTAREVDATVARHTGASTTRTSLAITLHLEGPPTRADWRFVTVVSVRAVPEDAQ